MKAVFLDRDGVINRQIFEGYVTSWSEFDFLPGVFSGMKSLSDNDFSIFIITNQQGIGKGLMTSGDLEEIHKKMVFEFERNNILVKKIYYCPHLESDRCICRKPKTGMIWKALKDFPGIIPDKAYIIGDSQSDIELGKRMGLKTIHIAEDRHYSYRNKNIRHGAFPDHNCDDLIGASNIILQNSGI